MFNRNAIGVRAHADGVGVKQAGDGSKRRKAGCGCTQSASLFERSALDSEECRAS